MKAQYSVWQTQRRCCPDHTERNRMILVKGCSRLGLTYQIAYLSEEAERRGLRFILRVPKGCRLSAALRQFLREHKQTRLERF